MSAEASPKKLRPTSQYHAKSSLLCTSTLRSLPWFTIGHYLLNDSYLMTHNDSRDRKHVLVNANEISSNDIFIEGDLPDQYECKYYNYDTSNITGYDHLL